MKYSKYNVIIIGSGLAGLYLANKLSDNNNFNDGILLITKDEVFSGSSSLAQGGIVSVIPEINQKDSIESHIKDTLKAGCGLNKLDTVKMVSVVSSTVADELMRFGVEFDKNDKNQLNFTLEGAHSCPRILHCNGDSTGEVIEKTLTNRLMNKNNVDIYTNTMAVELLVDNDNVCRGVVSFNHSENEYETIYSNNVVIATGGIGQVYKNTTNPIESTGDGIAIAKLAGAELENMEFVQFHPTALCVQNKQTMPLVSESVRGEGAKLVDINGDYFAKDYNELADLAPRDVVSRAIKEQMKKTNSSFVNLDISQIGIEKFKQRFPTIYSLCQENNIDISNGLIPVVPTQHYFMGGIKIDIDSATSIDNLYAIGECSSSGLHGANRLASNSLLECGVFAHNLSEKLIKENLQPPKKHDIKVKNTIDKYFENNTPMDFQIDELNKIYSTIKSTMTEYVGIYRDENSLNKALDIISDLQAKFNKISTLNYKLYYEVKNMLIVSYNIALSALNRRNSIGAHYRADYTNTIQENKEEKTNNEQILVK